MLQRLVVSVYRWSSAGKDVVGADAALECRDGNAVLRKLTVYEHGTKSS